jgi:hypothetical protein
MIQNRNEPAESLAVSQIRCVLICETAKRPRGFFVEPFKPFTRGDGERDA